MNIISGYLHNSMVDFMDKSVPLIVGSCGHYQIHTSAIVPTYRPKGRLDYQIIYVVSGKAHFLFDDKTETIVTAGNMVIYRPKEIQHYNYYASESPEVYWVHFSGRDVKSILRTYGIDDNIRILPCGTSLDYSNIFDQMIFELQTCPNHYENMLTLYLTQLLILLQRKMYTPPHNESEEYINQEIEIAIQYFKENYAHPIDIAKYASSRGMSISWFIRSFKQVTQSSPLQYLINLRMMRAQILLETTNYSIAEISSQVGYQDPMYFSRVFRKQKGFGPSEYRNKKTP